MEVIGDIMKEIPLIPSIIEPQGHFTLFDNRNLKLDNYRHLMPKMLA
jgi:hypothetical protein